MIAALLSSLLTVGASAQAQADSLALLYGSIIDTVVTATLETRRGTVVLIDSTSGFRGEPQPRALPASIPTRHSLQRVPRAALDSLRRQHGVKSFWQHFAKRFPGAVGWLGLGTAQVLDNGKGAQVAYE